MYLLNARKEMLKELGFTEGYFIYSSKATAVVVLSPALYMMLLLKYPERTSMKSYQDNHKIISISSLGDYFFYQTNDIYDKAIQKIAKLSPVAL